MIYTHIVHLKSGVPVTVKSKELPSLSEQNLLHFERPDEEKVTFNLEAVAYFSTKAGE